MIRVVIAAVGSYYLATGTLGALITTLNSPSSLTPRPVRMAQLTAIEVDRLRLRRAAARIRGSYRYWVTVRWQGGPCQGRRRLG